MPSWTKEQLDAINIEGQNIIVSAGAGSGKTAVLSERVLRKVLGGVDVDKLLILTFTNAAALEMKERIRRKLSSANLSEQLDKLDSAYITTFDSYALSIVKKYNYLLNVSKNVSIIDQSIIGIKKQEIMDILFDSLYEIKDESFLALINDFCTKDDTEIKKYILSINSKLDMIYDKELYLASYIETYFSDELIDSSIKEYEDLLLDKLALISKELNNFESLVEEEYYAKVCESLEELLISNSYESIKSNLITLPNLPKNSEEDAKKSKEKISNLLKELSKMCLYKNKEEIKISILETKKYIQAIIDVIIQFDSLLNSYKSSNDLYEFNDIALMAIKVLANNKAVRDEIKENLNEIMIDEYQDTNDLQDLFISYIENNNVYMVGDIKQSIYRFRNANPNLFKNKYDKYSNHLGGIKIDLNQNFRSREEVLSNINLIFDLIMDNKVGGAEYSRTHRMIFGNKTYIDQGKTEQSNNVEIMNYNFTKGDFKKEEIEIFTIAKDIKNKIDNKYQVFNKDTLEVRNMNYSDIVILMDRSTNFDLYKKIFEYLNIPLTVYKDESITDSIDISILKNILNLIICFNKNDFSKSFEYSFISVARSYLFRLSDEEIFEYLHNKNYKDSYIYTLINKNIDSINPSLLLSTIIDEFKFYEKIITVGDIDSHIVVLDYILSLASDMSLMGYTVVDFYNYLDKIINEKYDIKFSLNKEEKNSVKIMTIHKSKGLEYHICYYSGLYAKFNTKDLKERFTFDLKYGILSPYFNNGIRQTIYKDLLKNSYLNDEISEKIRLFYVALTRTKEKMIIVAPLNLNDSESVEEIVDTSSRLGYTSFLDILNSISSKISLFVTNIDIDSIGLTKNYGYIKENNYKDKITLIDDKILVNKLDFKNELVEEKHFSKEAHNLYTKEEINNIEIGKDIHNTFENIDLLNPDYCGLDDFVKTKVSSFVESGILDGVINIFKEYEFIYTVDNQEFHGFIDLLLEFKDSFKIVDYKLKNVTDISYLKQLEGYKKYIENLTDKKVDTYLYSILDEKLIKC